MSDGGWNPWKMTAIGMALVIITALVTGLVVANWPGKNGKEEAQTVPARRATAARVHRVVATPSAADIEACDRYARSVAGSRTSDVLSDALIGGAVGAGVGAAGGAIAGGGKNVGKGAAIGGLAGATAGTIHGLSKPSTSDPRYVEAYRSCLRGRGF